MNKMFVVRALVAGVLSALAVSPAHTAVEPVKEPPSAPDLIQTVEPILKEMAATQTQLPVLLILNAQPQHRLAKEIRGRYTPQIEKLAATVRALYAPNAPKVALATEDEEQAHATLMVAQTPDTIKKEVDELNRQREALSRQMHADIAKVTEQAIAPSQREIIELVEELGGKVRERVGVLNTIVADIPSSALDRLASDKRISEIAYNRPGKEELDNQASSLGASTWWNAGFDGGVWDVGVLDTGVAQSHPALSSHTFYENYAPNGSHGTGVACMYASTNATYRGLAFGLDAIIVDDAGDTGTSMAGADWMLRMAGDDPEVINYSYGNGGASGSDWSSMAKFVDAVVFDYNTPWAKSAGNEGFGTTTLTIPGDNYNGMTVANIYDQNTVNRSDDVIHDSSSRGPTKNGRKKPDIAAPGHSTSTCDTGSGWTTLGGTSSAAPKVGAGTLLLTDGGNWDPKAIKAVLVNTADSWEDSNTESTVDDGPISGKEWNKTYGWGQMDLWHAHFHRNDYFTGSVKPKGQTGAYKLYKGYAYNGDKATLVWEREVDYNNAATPVSYRNLSDLDLKLYRESDNSQLDSDTTVSDNVHQVAVDAAAGGVVVVKVYAYSSGFDGASTEPYALATEEGFSTAVGPILAATTRAPLSVLRNNLFTFTATANNRGDVDAHGVNLTLNLPKGFTLVSGARVQSAGRVDDGRSETVRWTVRAPLLLGLPTAHTLSVDVKSASYGETYSARGTRKITVN